LDVLALFTLLTDRPTLGFFLFRIMHGESG
jgi:hypothetical protein